MMKKIITILGLIIISFHSTLFAQNQKILLLGECDKESTTNMLNYLDRRANISLSVDNNITLSSNNISSYPIIFVCNNDYLKLNNDDASLLQNHLKQGGLLILDNINIYRTYIGFLNKENEDNYYKKNPNLFPRLRARQKKVRMKSKKSLPR